MALLSHPDNHREQQVLWIWIEKRHEQQGLAYFDNAIDIGPDSHLPLLMPARLNLEVLRSQGLTALLSEFDVSKRSSFSVTDGVARKLTDLPAAERQEFLHNVIINHAGAVFRHPDPTSIRVDSEFRSLGFDSLTSVEMSDRLAAAVGLRLPATAVFDHPPPATLAKYIGDQLGQTSGPVHSVVPTTTDHGESARSFAGLLRQAISQ